MSSSYKRKNLAIISVLFCALIFIAVMSLRVGSYTISTSEFFSAIFGTADKNIVTVLFSVRLPRLLAAITVGFALATTGVIMQAVLRNPLASASTLGVSQGASFGATFAIVVLGAGMTQNAALASAVKIVNPWIVSLFAFFGGLLSTIVLVMFSRVRKITPSSMVLCGVAISSLMSGGSILIQYFANEVVLASVVYWTFGDLGRATFTEIGIVFAVSLICFVYYQANYLSYNALSSGEFTAKSLGINTERLMLTSMVLSSLTASVAVCFVGIISFIGLIAPHLMRKIIGADHRYLLPASALLAAILLVASDMFARLVISPIILPIGAITSFLGAPLFLYMVYKGAK